MILYFSIYEYDYYNNSEEVTGAAWCWDSYFTEKPRDLNDPSTEPTPPNF